MKMKKEKESKSSKQPAASPASQQYICQYKIQNIVPNTFSNKESIAHKESLHNLLEKVYSLYSIVGGGFTNHFWTLLGNLVTLRRPSKPYSKHWIHDSNPGFKDFNNKLQQVWNVLEDLPYLPVSLKWHSKFAILCIHFLAATWGLTIDCQLFFWDFMIWDPLDFPLKHQIPCVSATVLDSKHSQHCNRQRHPDELKFRT